MRERLNAALRQVTATLRRMRHLPIPEQGRSLRLVLNGFYNYYAVPTNSRALNAFYYHVLSHWLRCLRRRSQRHRLTWREMMRIAERRLPSPKLRHPYPDCGRDGDCSPPPPAQIPDCAANAPGSHLGS